MGFLKHLFTKLSFNSSRGLFTNKHRYLSISHIIYDDQVTFVKKHNTLSESTKKRIEEEVAKESKNWISYGFSVTDKDEDTFKFVAMNLIFVSFFGGTLVFLLVFFPKQREKDWTTREAYLELERREKLGLQLIDPNFIPPERICLPSEEELGPKQIIL